jgi:dihydroorotate dehydrogenase
MIHRPLLLLPPETAHHLAMGGLSALGRFPRLCAALRRRTPSSPVEVAGLRFDNPIGLAAGLDKNATAVAGLFALGFGHVEIGTVTPRPQPGNPRPRIFRLAGERALVNRMGFPSDGAEAVAARLARLRYRPGILGINIGKNKDTPLEQAATDYRAVAQALGRFADYLAINASSPNTPGLRRLQEPDRLAAVLAALPLGPPVFVKIAPDLGDDEIDAVTDAVTGAGAAGIIATNTTAVTVPEPGGLSGAPLRERATAVIRRVADRAGGRLAIIAVGGVATAADVREKLAAGASLVQLYTSFIYRGPGLPRRLMIDLTVGEGI